MNKKRIYRILFVLLTFLTIAGVAGILLQQYFNDKIRDLFIRELNKQLSAEVQVQQVKLSVFRDFPSASVRVTGLTMKEAVKRPNKGILMKAGLISLRFSLFDLFTNNISVTNIMISNAKFNMREYRDGTDNYHFWKSSGAKTGKDLKIDLQKIIILNSRITYLDESSGEDYRFMLKETLMKGKFSSDEYLLDASGDLNIELFTSNHINYLKDRNTALEIIMKIEDSKGFYQIQKGNIRFAELGLGVKGTILHSDNLKEIDLSIETTSATLSELVSTIPAKYLKQLDDYRFEGDAMLTAKVKGSYNGSEIPAIQAQLSLVEGVIGKKSARVSLEDVSLSATYNSGQNRNNEQLSINEIKGKLRNGFISGNLKMTGFKSSMIKATLKADVDLNDAKELLNTDTITEMNGRLLLDGVFEGRLADLNKPALTDLPRCRLSGKLQVSKAVLGLKGYSIPMEKIDGEMIFANNSLQLRNLSFLMGKSDFKAKGNVENLMAWLLVKNQKLSFQGDISSNRTDWDEISESSSGSGEYHFTLPSDIEIQGLRLHVKNFTFRKFQAASISADLKMKNKVISATNILMQSMKGVVSGQASINGSSQDHALIQCKVTISKVNLKSLFAEFGNFGTTDLTYENLDGTITADVVFASVMYPNLDMDLPSVKAHADIRVENGRLVNYEPMKGLSKFLRVEDLADIRFETLQNQIDIANRIIYIPVMQIKSSAIDLNLMGTHTFDNELDYHFSLSLADLMAAKFNKRNPGYNKTSEFGPIEDDGRGRTMVYVSMTGTVDNPVFAYDKKAVRDKIASQLKSQKVELKEVFKKEFGGGQDSIMSKQQTKEKTIQKKQEEGKFVIEWDDDKK